MTSEFRAVIAWIRFMIFYLEYWILFKQIFLRYLAIIIWHSPDSDIEFTSELDDPSVNKAIIMGTYLLAGLLIWLEKPECGMPSSCVLLSLLFCANLDCLSFLGQYHPLDENWRICCLFLMLLNFNWQLIWHSGSLGFSFKESPYHFLACGNSTPSSSTKECCSPPSSWF